MNHLRLRLYGANLGPLPVTWEAAFQHLEQLPRMYAEPDGSFLWSGQDPEFGTWQIEGTVFDDGTRVRRVELVGNCSQSQWSRLLDCFHSDWDSISAEDLTNNQVVDGAWLRSAALFTFILSSQRFGPRGTTNLAWTINRQASRSMRFVTIINKLGIRMAELDIR